MGAGRRRGEDAGRSWGPSQAPVTSPRVVQYPSRLFAVLGIIEVLMPSQHYGWMEWIVCQGHQVRSITIVSQWSNWGGQLYSESEGELCFVAVFSSNQNVLPTLISRDSPFVRCLHPDSPNHATPVGRGQVRGEKGRGDQKVWFMKNTMVEWPNFWFPRDCPGVSSLCCDPGSPSVLGKPGGLSPYAIPSNFNSKRGSQKLICGYTGNGEWL